MRFARALFITFATAFMCSFAAPSGASLGTNFSDQWWNPNEPGWGVSILHQFNTLFVDLFVYGPDPDNRTTWYTAAVYLDPQTGRPLFTGDLYTATGPWFGAFYNPAAFMSRRVGTLTFDASSTDFATLTYSVDGVSVTKSAQRQLWTYEDFTGSYYGGLVYDQSACANPLDNGHVEEFGPFQVNHPADNSFTLALQSNFGNCTIAGNYSQLGHMGTVDASYTCTYGISGTMTLYELERTGTGMTGRFIGHNSACTVSGTLGGVER